MQWPLRDLPPAAISTICANWAPLYSHCDGGASHSRVQSFALYRCCCLATAVGPCGWRGLLGDCRTAVIMLRVEAIGCCPQLCAMGGYAMGSPAPAQGFKGAPG